MRRRIIIALAAGWGLSAIVSSQVMASSKDNPQPSADTVVVLTSYPDELIGAYQRAFEAAYPGTSLSVIWAHSVDAIKRLQQADGGQVDVYWAPAPAAFAALAGQGRLQPLAIEGRDLPGVIGHQAISDPQHRFEAFEVSGYGFAVNQAALQQRHLPIPQSWSDLAAPAYAGLVQWPDPTRAGFSPAMYDIILQGHGWTAGWALLSEAVAAGSLGGRPSQTMDAVVAGSRPIGPSIDFLVRSAAADGEPVQMIYPQRTAFLPAHVAVLKQAPHPQAAQRFAQFVLSAPGQRILFQPDISRYPVRPEVYAQAPAGSFNPFLRHPQSGFAYDPVLTQARSALVVALFNSWLVQRHAQLVSVWSQLHQLEARAVSQHDHGLADAAAQARSLLSQAPLTAEQAASPTVQALFQHPEDGPKDAPPNPAQQAELNRWQQGVDARIAQAQALLAAHDPKP